jgi:hypothetical protein
MWKENAKMIHGMVRACCLAGVLLHVSPSVSAPSQETALQIPAHIVTHADGRAPIQQLYASYAQLIEEGWILEIVHQSKPFGTSEALPIIALRSPNSGPAAWFLAGIHGEEPAGPNAISEAIGELAALGKEHPVVLLPLCNPHGYARNWRYLNVSEYSETIEGNSVGDSSHLLPEPERANTARAAAASSPEAAALGRYIVDTAARYPPVVSIDLHEDKLLERGYVYSQGKFGADDDLALAARQTLLESDIPLQMNGKTRFDEPIVGGIIGPVIDSSIDELMSSASIIVDGKTLPGPGARTVLVFETPAKNTSLSQRINAHRALIRRVSLLIASSL